MGYFTDTQFDSTSEMLDAVTTVIDRFVQELREVPATDLGLDPRCGTVFVSEDCIVAYRGSRIDYYGGFEYVRGDDRKDLGEYVFYFDTDERVRDCLECLLEADGECESESDGQPTEQEEWASFNPDC
jgi:hypothetical protein